MAIFKMSRYFHEHQKFGHCAVHALNNLLQCHWISFSDCEAIANYLHSADRRNGNCSWYNVNPYKSVLPAYGNFDIAVIVEALKRQSMCIAEHITRWSPLRADILESSVGIFVNRTKRTLDACTSGHWYSIVKIRGFFVILDSNRQRPVVFESDFPI